MKTTFSLLALPFLAATPLSAQVDPSGPGQDLIELFEKMHRDGATEDDLRRMLEQRAEKDLLVPEAPHEHDHGQADREAPEAPRWRIGLIVEPVPPFVREHLGLEKDTGVRVAEVADGSPAERAGIRVNDLLLSAGDKKIASLDDLKAAVEQAGRNGQPLKLGWIHKGERREAELRPDGPPAQEPTDRAGGEPERPAMMRRMEEMHRRMERQQREIGELRREIERLKREVRNNQGE